MPTIRSHKARVAVCAVIVAIFSLFPLQVAFALNDYPWQTADPNQLSPLRFNYRNCTDFVAWRLNKQQGVTQSPWTFTWSTLGFPAGAGNAADWKDYAVAKGYTVNNTAAVGAVAWWGSERASGFGHVAIVSSVNANGTSNIEQYNAGFDYAYSTASNITPDAYLHIADSSAPIHFNPAAVSWGLGRIDTFGQGTDGKIYTNYYASSSGWSGFTSPAPTIVGSGPAVSSWGQNRLDVFARGTGADLIHSWYDGSWHNWETLSGQIKTGTDPASVSWGLGRIDTFLQGTDGIIYTKYYDVNSGGWSGFAAPVPTVVGSGPAVASWSSGRLDLFARGTGGDLIHAWYDGTWHNWESLGGQIMAGTNPAAVSWSSGHIDVFLQGTDGVIYQDTYNTTSGWSGFMSPVPTIVGSGPAVSSWGQNRLDVFARGTGGDLIHAWYDGSWHNWESLGGTLN